MNKQRKKWSEMTAEELAEATREFDDPSYHPPAIRPTSQQLAALRRVQREAKLGRSSVPVLLERRLIEQADDFAVTHGITFSELVAKALKVAMRRKSA